METTYTYSIKNDTANGAVHTESLSYEIISSQISTPLAHVNTDGDDLLIVFDVAISSYDKELLDTIVADHTGAEPIESPNIISEDKSFTGGNFQMRGFELKVPPNGTNYIELTWEYNIRLLAIFLVPANDGDEAEGCLGENTPVGIIVQNASAGDKELFVSPTVMEYILVGRKLALFNGSVFDEGIVVAIDKNLGTVRLDKALTADHAAGEYCLMTVPLSHGKVPLKGGIMCECGGTALGGSFIPANLPFKISYHNNSDEEVSIYYKLEYWY